MDQALLTEELRETVRTEMTDVHELLVSEFRHFPDGPETNDRLTARVQELMKATNGIRVDKVVRTMAEDGKPAHTFHFHWVDALSIGR